MPETAAEKKARLAQEKRTTWVIPDAAWQGLFATIVTIVLAYMQLQTRNSVDEGNIKVDNAIEKADEAIVKTEAAVETVTDKMQEVASNQHQKLEVIGLVADKTHAIVNSDSLAKDKIVALVLKQLSLLTKDPQDIEAARLAEVQYEENLAKQKALEEKAFPKAEP